MHSGIWYVFVQQAVHEGSRRRLYFACGTSGGLRHTVQRHHSGGPEPTHFPPLSAQPAVGLFKAQVLHRPEMRLRGTRTSKGFRDREHIYTTRTSEFLLSLLIDDSLISDVV